MPDLSVTATSVVAYSGASFEQGTCGETITAGQTVYKDTSTNLWMKSDANVSAKATIGGIALNGGSVNQPLKIQTGGGINPGATVAVGATYVVSAAAGGICPEADIGSGEYLILLGIGITTSRIEMAINLSTIVAHA